MTRNELLIKISTLKEIRDTIQREIDLLESSLDSKKLEEEHNTITSNTKDGFFLFLTKFKNLSDRTIKNYFVNLRNIRELLYKFDNYKLDCEIFNIEDINKLKEIKMKINSCEEIKLRNIKRHNQLSAAFNNYYDYISNYYNVKIAEDNGDFIFDD